MHAHHAMAAHRSHVLVLETGDEINSSLRAFASAHSVSACSVTGIGAVSRARLAYFDAEAKQYIEIAVDEQVEFAALHGNITRFKGDNRMHLHAVLSRRDGTTIAGHLVSATVRPTLELFVTETGLVLERAEDPDSGLPLIQPRR